MRRGFAAGVALALSLSACSGSSHEIGAGPPVVPTEAVNPATGPAANGTARLAYDTARIMDLSVLPDTLPAAVRAAVASVVELRADIYERYVDKKGTLIRTEPVLSAKASGVNLGNGNVLTAGHVVRQDSGSLQTDFTCGDFVIARATPNGTVTSRADQQHSTFKRKDPKVDDVNLMHLQGGASASVARGTVPIAVAEHTNIAFGDPLFFINYEAPDNEHDRSPVRGSSPAIFGGVALTELGIDNDWLVITGFRSYTSGTPEMELKPGGSGGVVVNIRGELVAISNAAVPEPEPVQQFEADYHLDVTHDRPGLQISRTFIEPVDRTVITRLEAGLRTAPEPCEPAVQKTIVVK